MISADDKAVASRLRAFCEAVDGKPVAWSVDDCSTWPLQWVLNETGKESSWPHYSTRDEAHSILDKAGGLEAVWVDKARELGLKEVASDVIPAGSVGIVDTRQYGLIGCIFAVGNMGCFRTDGGWRGWGVRRRYILRAWSLK